MEIEKEEAKRRGLRNKVGCGNGRGDPDCKSCEEEEERESDIWDSGM